MIKITNIEFIDKYKPIKNEKYPTTLLKDTVLHPYVYQKDEYALLAEYIRPRQFFTVINAKQFNYVLPGLKNGKSVTGYIITECPYREENLEWTATGCDEDFVNMINVAKTILGIPPLAS